MPPPSRWFFAFVKSAFIPPHTAICFAASFCNITYFPFLGKLQAMLIVHRVMNVTRFRSFRVGARSIECFSSLSSRQKMLFLYPRYGKRLIFRAMQAMQFIRVYEHTEKTLFIRSALCSFMRIKKPRPPRGDCGFFCFLLGLFQMVKHLAVSAILVFP